MNNLPENIDTMDVLDLTKPSLENLYLGNKFAQWVCLEINQTANIRWDNLVKDYRLSLNAKYNKETLSSFDKISEVNLQEQLRDLSGRYLDNLSIEINNLFQDIKNFNDTYLTYYPYLKPAIENFKDGNYSTILTLLQDKIRGKEDKTVGNKEKAKIFCEQIDDFLISLDKNYLGLHEKEERCRVYLNDFEKDIDAILEKIETLNEEIKQKNINQIKESYKNNSALTFSIRKLDKKDKNNKEISKEEELENLKEKLNEYNQEYSLLVGLVYLAKQFTNAAHTIKLGVKMVSRSWEALDEYFSTIELQLQEKGEDTIEPILNSLDVIKDVAETVNSKIEQLKDGLKMKVLSPYNNEKSTDIVDSSFLKLVCQN